MKYHFSEEINYEREAVNLIMFHYGEEKGCRSWTADALEGGKYPAEWLEALMQPLIAIEDEVFKKVTISDKDYQLYFAEKNSNLEGEDSIANIMCEIEYFNSEDEQEQKKLFSCFALPDYAYKEEESALSAEEFYRQLRLSSIEAEVKWEYFEIYCNFAEHRKTLKKLLAPVVQLLKKHEAQFKQMIAENPMKESPFYLDGDKLLADLGIEEVHVDFWLMGFNKMAIHALKIKKKTVGFVHYGIFVDRLALKKREKENNGLWAAEQWKSLSDKSRIQILSLLKEREMFGQELKEALGLSNATISHHMNELMAKQFVTLRNDGSKVVYRLNREKIEEAIEGMRQVLLG